jgi:hypothetical protein
MLGRADQSPKTGRLVHGRHAFQTSPEILSVCAHVFQPWHLMTAFAIVVPRIKTGAQNPAHNIHSNGLIVGGGYNDL